MAKNTCFFSKYGIEPNYKDIENISKFLSPQMKLLNREKSGVSAKNQRKLSKAVKHARYLALIPYTSNQ
ncbi:MAG: 30S ribosomal protein S18 [Patescibacteria group bacterium]